METISKTLSNLSKLFTKRIPYLFTLRNVLFISLFLGGIQVFVTIFLEPHGTGNYQVTGRNILLSGYIFCFVFPFLIIYGIEKWIYSLQHYVWKVYQEVISKVILIILIATASYFYNITFINSISPSPQRWLEHMLIFAWPYILLFVPFMIIIYAILNRNHPQKRKIKITGQNQDDILNITETQFIYAESDQNYVTIYYKKGSQITTKLMRSSLQAIDEQIKVAVRVHRSYLINPTYLKTIEGNKRKKKAILEEIDSIIPVSANFEKDSVLRDSF